VDKSSRRDIALEEQRQAWNQWNSQVLHGNARALREWAEIETQLKISERHNLRILEVGCGAGWLAERLMKYGAVTATDLSDEVLEAKRRLPAIDFRKGDFFQLELPTNSFDVVVTQHVLAHVSDQPAFITRIADLLVEGGRIIIVTQNRPVLERWSAIPGPYPGQLRRWVSARELRHLVNPHFKDVEISSVLPAGDQGFLRVVNSYKVNRILQSIFGADTIHSAKEKALLGQSLILCATR